MEVAVNLGTVLSLRLLFPHQGPLGPFHFSICIYHQLSVFALALVMV